MKPVIYQILPRLYTNRCAAPKPAGDIETNGVGKFDDYTPAMLTELQGRGITHLWLTGVIEHATATDYSAHGILPDNPSVVKGKAGSPYAIKDYYDVDPDLARVPEKRMEEFEALVKRIHDSGLKLIIDFVPNHVARRYHSDAKPVGIEDFGAHDDTSLYFGHNNNFYYIPRQRFTPQLPPMPGVEEYVEFPAKASGNDCFTAFPGVNDWYETVKLNYGYDYGDHSRHFHPTPDTWYKMLHILRYWAAKGVDGFRCDMVHMVPTEFWRWAIPAVKANFPHVIFIGEIYDVGQYRPYLQAGFDYLYDKVNLYDTLRGVVTSGVSAAQLTGCWQTVEDIKPHMLNFLENHDEQRIGSPQFAGDPRKGIAPLAVAAFMGEGPLMVYMGQEVGETGTDAEGFSGRDGRTTIFDYWSLPTMRRWLDEQGQFDDTRLSQQQLALKNTYTSIMRACNASPAISRGRFFDLMYVNYDRPADFDPHRHYAFMRSSGGETVVVIANFADREAVIKTKIPAHAFDTLGIRPVRSANAVDLISGAKISTPLLPDGLLSVKVPANGAVALRFATRKA